MGIFATKMAFDKFTKVSMPIITRHPNKNAMNAANAWLQDLHYNSVLSALECYSYDTGAVSYTHLDVYKRQTL